MNSRHRQEIEMPRNKLGRVAAMALVVLGLALTAHSRSARTTTTVTPAQVNDIFAKWNKPDSPGCALAVIQNGNIVYEHGYGQADL